jgi:hypothetical protein
MVYEYSPTATLNPSALSQPRLFINIDMVCVQRGTATNPNSGTAVPTAPGVNGCDSATTTTTALRSVIFNTQPYSNNQTNYLFTFSALLGSVFSTIGDDAVSSGLTDVKLVKSGNTMNGKNFQLTHPIKGGPSGILGLRGGYGASYAMQHSRVDGSNPPTADWSFGGHGITSGLSKLKLPVQVLGTACDIKEDIALDATANLLVCRNSIWSTLSTANAGTVNTQEYLLYDINAYPTNLPINSIKQYYCNVNTMICTLTGDIANNTLNVIYGTASGYSNPSIKCGEIRIVPSSNSWQPALFETYDNDLIVSVDVAFNPPNARQLIIRYCTVGGVIFNRKIRLNKINQ